MQREEKLLVWCCSDVKTAKKGEAINDDCRKGTIEKIYKCEMKEKTKIWEK
jgi:hypothetical protein